MQVRSADAVEIDHLSRLWYDGWHQLHAPLMPPELIRLRTLDSFRERLQAAISDIRVAGPLGTPIGFYVLKGDELYQLFVSPEAHGSGVGAALIADAEARLAEHGVETAWLACVIGNDRAVRFYEKSGWRLAGTVVQTAETSSGLFPLEEWRYEKRLARSNPVAPELIRGKCLCGSFQFEILGPIGEVRLCHCDLCRRANGTAFSANARIPLERYRVIAGEDLISEYESSLGARRCFCSRCGSPVFARVAQDPDHIRIRLGTLDREADAEITAHVWVGSKAQWDRLIWAVPSYERGIDSARLSES
jgi:GNAT superfamily N-acetyltransferase